MEDSVFGSNRNVHHNGDDFQELKSDWRLSCANHGSIRVSADYCFSRSCEGGESRYGSQPELWTNHPEDPHPRPFRSEHTDDERVESMALPANRRNGYVVQFSFFGSNVSPFFQILRAIAEIFRASVSRAISLRMPFFSNP